MNDRERRLIDIAAAVSDGSDVDWAAAESIADTDAERCVVRDLKMLARVGAFRRSEISSASACSDPPDTSDAGRDRRTAAPAWGPLRLLEPIGSGRFGEVYRAWDARLEREVALKVLRTGRTVPAPNAIREARLLARVRHGNVVTVHGADVVDGRTGLWMEFIRGSTLGDAVAANGPFGARETAAIGIDLCRALAAVHDAGLVHRDVKPQNVMREPGGRIVLMDFGAGAEESSRRAARGVAGTPLYLAPELFDAGPATVRSDIYSLGVLLFFLVTGRHPVSGSTAEELRARHARGTRLHLRQARPDLPVPFVEAVERAVKANPAHRYETAEAFESTLARARAADLPVPSEPYDAVPDRPWLRRVALSGLGVIVLVLTGALAAWRFGGLPLGPHARGASLGFAARDWVLVASFENRTGEALLDGTIEAAFERELANSRFVNVAPRVRIEDTLRLMGRPADTRVDAKIGREISMRDGGIRAILAGRLERLGPAYLLSAVVLDPADGAATASVSEEAAAASDLSRALRRLSNGVREALGESRQAVHQDDRRLERVTTPSLTALRLYTDSYRLGDRGDWRPALEFARQAVREDPAFAAAQIWLAWTLQRNAAPAADVEAAAARAVQLADNATEQERHWIIGSYHSLRREFEKAIPQYELLLRLDPDHRWTLNNLTTAYRTVGRLEDVERLAVHSARLADLRPTSVAENYSAGVALMRHQNFEGARRYFTRVKQLTTGSDLPAADLWPGTYARLAPAYEAWFKSPIITTGTGSSTSFFLTVWLKIRGGLLEDARLDVEGGRKSFESSIPYLNGDLALARGNVDAAVELLRPVIDNPPRAAAGSQLFCRGAEALAAAHLRNADVENAAGVLRAALAARRPSAAGSLTGHYFWMRLQLRLAELDRSLGREAEARALEEELARLLAVADPDFPPLVRLRKLRSGRAVSARAAGGIGVESPKYPERKP
ncbi:MAG: hypothetical protein A3G21_17890 [Acidobacteria bacterium RIFCSPLOWO2_12_FULL_66_21]|nr:MAG: hypothetical protein A3G21_17890 [Acidobacteria bacterium RIFCSPLOWO2_12_FULL_66_21]